MQWRNTNTSYGLVSKILHWGIVAGIIAQYFLAEAAEEHEGVSQGPFAAGSIHISLGVTLLVLALVRVLWRAFEYRLAPATAFPGSLEDNYAALAWLHKNATELGVDGSRIAVMGESAGGGHAAMLAIAARDRGEVLIVFTRSASSMRGFRWS